MIQGSCTQTEVSIQKYSVDTKKWVIVCYQVLVCLHLFSIEVLFVFMMECSTFICFSKNIIHEVRDGIHQKTDAFMVALDYDHTYLFGI